MQGGVVGGVSSRTFAPGAVPAQYPDQLSANTTFLQTGAGGYARVSTALMALNQSQNVVTLSNAVGTIEADITTLQSQIATLQSQVATLQGQAAAFTAFMASFNYQQLEISTGTYYLNGTLIYRRTFVMPATMLTAGQINIFAHGIANIGYIVTMQAVASLYQGQTLPMTFLQINQQPPQNGLSCWGDVTNIYVAVGTTGFTTYIPIATMWYTATDR